LRRKPPLRSGWNVASWLNRHGSAVRLAGCFVFVTLAAVFVGFAPESNLIWVANGVLLAYLLLAPRRRWAAYLGAGFAGQMVGALVVDPQWKILLTSTVFNLAEVLIAALLLRKRATDLPNFTDRAYLARFLAFAVLVAPLAAGLMSSVCSIPLMPMPFGVHVVEWTVADGLGTAVTTPACVAIFRARFRKCNIPAQDWFYLILLAVLSLGGLSQARAPLAFILYPVLLLILLRTGLGWASMATLFVAAAGSWFTLRGQGPFASSNTLSPLEPSILLQIFVACAMFMLYSVSVVLESRRATERRLQEIAALHNLVTENSRDVIIIADFDGNRSYVSAAASHLAGWTREEVLERKSLDLVHPEDRPRVVETVLGLRDGADGAMVECRIEKKEGGYLWVEASLRTIRDRTTKAPRGVLNNVRDISERKLAEKKLQDAYQAVEALAVTDALTGLANRRRFDQCLTTEWRRGMRDHRALSLLLIDVDLFKSYNDTYGHLRGDSCLKQIAEAAQDVVSRPGDLVARFGGEEFAIVLPATDRDGALQIANDICAALRSRKLPHKGNPGGIMTVSVGCATLVPHLGQGSTTLIDIADEALYRAKRSGRNRVCSGEKDGVTECGRETDASEQALHAERI